MQSPFALSDDSEPEPDVAVVPAGDYRQAQPDQALLIIEVADSSLHKDRGIKTALYASAGIPELWVVNLSERLIEVHRRPDAGRYSEVFVVDDTGTISPAAFPQLMIATSEIWP